jgi:hypothetical protein
VVFREVAVIEIREVLRCWLGGVGLRTAAERAGVDRKTARRYVEAAVAAGLTREGGEAQLTDELLGAVVTVVRPARRAGHGQAWETLLAEEPRIRDWIERDELQLTNIHGKLARRGIAVPYRTLHRFAVERCGFGRRHRRCGSPTASRGWSASWTSAGSAWSRTRTPGGGGSRTR